MFGRRKQQQQAEEARREAERRALFEELAKRPDTVCPFLGMEDARTDYRPRVSDGHRCYAFGDPAELSAEQQQKVCLQRGYGNCPRYLRGVLVIPTEELEALRRPQPAPPPPPLAAPKPVPAAPGGRGRGGLVAVALVLLVALGGGAVAFLALSERDGVGQETPTPQASPSVVPTVTGEPTTQPSVTPPPATATPVPTAVVVPSVDPSTGALPTPGPGDVSTGFIVVVQSGDYPVVRMDDDGTITGEATALFDRVSGAPVQRFEIDGVVYWRTLVGDYTGLAYSRDLSDNFVVYETYETEDGEARFRALEDDEY